MTITGIDHLVLTVADIERTCAFYTTLPGVEVVEYGRGRTALHFGDAKFNLHETDTDIHLRAASPTVGGADFCLVSDEPVESVAGDLEEAGIEVIEGPVERAGANGRMTSVYARDPDGNLVEIAHYG